MDHSLATLPCKPKDTICNIDTEQVGPIPTSTMSIIESLDSVDNKRTTLLET